MSCFAVFKCAGAASLELEQLDLNLWVLPALMRQQTFYVDIGIRARLLSEASGSNPLKLEVGIPLVASKGEIFDLIPRMRNNQELCSLVFGASSASLRSDKQGPVFQDGDVEMLLVDLSTSDCHQNRCANDKTFSTWIVSSGGRSLSAGTAVYLRFRFVTQSPGRLWTWQHGIRNRAHAISDIRVNEFRDKPRLDSPPDYNSDLLPIKRVNGFVIAAASYKAGRVNPQPKYVRVLENEAWRPYLSRRLTRRREWFLITYWKQMSVSRDIPFRAFMEAERRRPTAVKAVTLGAVAVVLLMAALQPLAELQASLLGELLGGIYRLLLAAFAGAGFVAALRFLISQLSKGRMAWLRRQIDNLGKWWYRP